MTDDLLTLAMAGLAPDRVERILHRSIDVERHDPSGRRFEGGATGHRAALERAGARFVTRADPGFPAPLAGLPGAPRWLFVRGRIPELAAPGTAGVPAVAVVGSRRASGYGLAVAERLGAAIGAAGWPVVSGLAAGVDGAAHRGCLDGGGVAVAVLGSGIDVWYPRRHQTLGEWILAAGGAVVSEFPPGTPPDPWRFPYRNRIISGLSAVVVVVEAAERSGALITARLALEQGREVVAVPGDVDRPTSRGCNLLIRDGAHPLTGTSEVVEVLELLLGPAPRPTTLPNARPTPEGVSPVLDLVGAVPVPLDDLAGAAEVPLGDLLAELARLELAGLVVVEEGRVRRPAASAGGDRRIRPTPSTSEHDDELPNGEGAGP